MPADLTRRALGTLAPASFDEADASVEVVLATATPVRRRDPAGPYDEILTVTPEAVRLDRLNAGAPVLDSHAAWSLADQIGAVIPGSARIESGQVVARVKLAERPEVAGLVADIRSGVIKNVSAGYRVLATEQEDVPGGVPVVRVTAWEPMEISFVPIPADPSAQTRAMPAIQEPVMHQNQNRAGAYSPADRQRIAETCFHGAVPDGFMQRTAALDDRSFHAAMVDELYRRSEAQPQTFAHTPAWPDARQADDGLNEAVTAALAARMGGPAPQGRARELAGMSLVQIGAELAEARGERIDWSARSRVADQAFARVAGPAGGGWLASRSARSGGLHSTSDFPSLLQAAGSRVLAASYEAAASPLKLLARKRSAQDFRTISVARLSEMPSLEKVGEGGEVTRGSVAESVEGFRLETFARIFGITRQALMNDDLNAFGDALAAFGRAAATKEADLLGELLAANGGAGVTLSDGSATFTTTRGNRASAGAALDVTSLGAARRALRDTKGLDGRTPIGLAPRHLLVGSDQETVAEQLLGTIYAAKSSDVVPEGLKLSLHVEPRLNGSGFRVFADASAAEVLSYAYLNGAEGVQFAQREGFDVLGIEFRGLLDFGCGITGHRGAFWTPAP